MISAPDLHYEDSAIIADPDDYVKRNIPLISYTFGLVGI